MSEMSHFWINSVTDVITTIFFLWGAGGIA